MDRIIIRCHKYSITRYSENLCDRAYNCVLVVYPKHEHRYLFAISGEDCEDTDATTATIQTNSRNVTYSVPILKVYHH